MKKILSIILLLFLSCDSKVFALEWKSLHERADTISLEDAKKAFENNPQSINDLYVLGLVYLNRHRDKEADDVFGKILVFDPRITEAKWGKAEVLRRRHDLDGSVRVLNEIIDKNPGFSPAYVSLAYIKYTILKFEEAVRLAYKVIKQGRDAMDLSNYVRAHVIIAGSKGMLAHYGGPLAKIKNGTAVLPYLKKAEGLQPDSAAVLFGLGSFYYLAPRIAGQDKVKAIKYLEKAIKADSLFTDAYVRLAQIYKVKGDNDKYRIYLNKAIEIDPNNELLLDMQSKKCKFICISLDK